MVSYFSKELSSYACGLFHGSPFALPAPYFVEADPSFYRTMRGLYMASFRRERNVNTIFTHGENWPYIDSLVCMGHITDGGSDSCWRGKLMHHH